MEVAAVILPLVGAVIAGVFGRFIGDRGAQLVTCGLMLVATLLSVVLFAEVAIGGGERHTELFSWIVAGSFEVVWAVKVDTLAAVMMLVVNLVSAMVHIYSIGYMHHDRSIPRFFSYLSLFTFFMLTLVSADNFVQLYFGWEGVGLCSYLLIGFWYDRASANAAAIKAFIVNRVGDFGFALGILGVFLVFDSVSFDTVFPAVPQKAGTTLHFLFVEADTLTVICILLFIGAMGKSAQILLHTWLPDAMEGPTPVSALIHAATMVTAGVFMVCRLSPMFEYAPDALALVAVVGALTAFMTGTIALVQNDIKRVIAYSTCSQLGYMFFAAGVSAYGAAIFHLMTHAFFKALLFLGAGSVIHAMSDEQDMRRMGGLWRLIPWTYAMMWIGSLALGGIFPFAGFFSKDIILESAWASHSPVGSFAFVLGVASAFLTAFYSWRLLLMTFHGAPRADRHTLEHVHESPWVMMAPLLVLAAGSVAAGWAAEHWFVGEARESFWRGSLLVMPAHDPLGAAHEAPLWVKLLPLVIGLAGIALAYVMYVLVPALPAALASAFRPVYLFLLNKWYFDELYDFLFVRPAVRLGRLLWLGGDGAVIDRFGPDGIAAATIRLARRASALQTGYVYHYAFAMLIGVVLLITWYLFVQAH